MGLSVAISGAVVLSVLMMVLMTMTGFVGNMFTVGDASTQLSELDKAISETEISMNHVSTLIGSPTLNFTLSNDGQEKLWNFEEFDLFVTYDGAVSGILTKQITYEGDCLGGLPAVGNWCIQSINGDMLDPGILNSAEGANIRIRVSENLATVNAVVSITTANGVTDTVMAPYCGPSCYQIIYRPLSDEGVIAWTNIGAGIEELDNNDNYRGILDLSDMTEWRIQLHVAAPAGVTCAIGAQYSTDGGATWLGLDNGNAGVMSTTTLPCTPDEAHLVSGWNQLNATAQSDVWVRIAGTGAGSADDPQFGTLELQFRS